MQFTEYYTSAAATPQLGSYFSFGVKSFQRSLSSAMGRRRFMYLAVLYHCFILVEEYCLSSTIVK